jgi:hypothetical protein
MWRWLVVVPLIGCSSSSEDGAAPLTCGKGLEPFRGRCVDPAQRYEPEQRIDKNNVVAYGDPLSKLKLPEPPKSGFRIVVPPRTMKPGEEVDYCVSWPFPKFQNKIVYAGKLYTTPGLHHSNVVTKVVDAKLGPNPYPKCHPGASDPFAQLPANIPDVLFANSTQVQGTEAVWFPQGMGFPVDTTREIVTNIHMLNTAAADERVEVVYDFFTMTAEDLVEEVAPIFMQVNDFLIPPHSTGEVGAECNIFGGTVVEMMPHTHKFLTEFSAELVSGGKPKTLISQGAFDTTSDVHLFDPGIDLSGAETMKFRCRFDNTTDHDIKYGIGENEMCILFGYVYPVEKQFVAYSTYQGQPCKSVQIGLFH